MRKESRRSTLKAFFFSFFIIGGDCENCKQQMQMNVRLLMVGKWTWLLSCRQRERQTEKVQSTARDRPSVSSLSRLSTDVNVNEKTWRLKMKMEIVFSILEVIIFDLHLLPICNDCEISQLAYFILSRCQTRFRYCWRQGASADDYRPPWPTPNRRAALFCRWCDTCRGDNRLCKNHRMHKYCGFLVFNGKWQKNKMIKTRKSSWQSFTRALGLASIRKSH